MPAFVRKSLETDKKRKALRSTNPRKLEDLTRFKSINRSATKYPSPPGVEGARLDLRAKPARSTSPESRQQERTQTAPKTKTLKARSTR
jgi:hypothetical protein